MKVLKKKKYDQYTLKFKKHAVMLSNHPNVMATDIAEILGIHVVMLYRWRMEWKRGELKQSIHMTKRSQSPPKKKIKSAAEIRKSEELKEARKRIKALERSLSATQEELDILKKAKRFFEKRKK